MSHLIKESLIRSLKWWYYIQIEFSSSTGNNGRIVTWILSDHNVKPPLRSHFKILIQIFAAEEETSMILLPDQKRSHSSFCKICRRQISHWIPEMQSLVNEKKKESFTLSGTERYSGIHESFFREHFLRCPCLWNMLTSDLNDFIERFHFNACLVNLTIFWAQSVVCGWLF